MLSRIAAASRKQAKKARNRRSEDFMVVGDASRRGQKIAELIGDTVMETTVKHVQQTKSDDRPLWLR